MEATLEAIGNAGIDPVPTYFEKFFARFPDQDPLFHHRETSQGMMFNEMIELLLSLAADKNWVPVLVCAHVQTHEDHGDLGKSQYRGALEILLEVLEDAAGNSWDKRQDAAWREMTDRLVGLFAKHA